MTYRFPQQHCGCFVININDNHTQNAQSRTAASGIPNSTSAGLHEARK